MCAALALGASALAAAAQTGNPSSATNPFYGSVTAASGDRRDAEAVAGRCGARGLENNLGLKEAENGEKLVKGEKNEALQEFLPTITAERWNRRIPAQPGRAGFWTGRDWQIHGRCSPAVVAPTGLSLITKDDLTQGQINFSQILFSGPVISGWQAAGAAERAAYFAKMSARGEVVQQVATAYLHAIAAASEVDNANALEQADRVLFDQAHAAHEAGTAANLDELRARVQLQAQQQALIAAQNTLEKDLILLKREIGVDPGQKIVLTDADAL